MCGSKSRYHSNAEFRMMTALHQNLDAARGGKFVELLIQLLAREDVMIGVLLRAVERAEFAVNVADVGVVDVAIDDVGHDLSPAPMVSFLLREIAPRIGQRA